ncbi:MAG: LptF/LptG family permease, partial [FCB group bacterium]|nr:LptF/LptG family permease [FCB group bacterium]
MRILNRYILWEIAWPMGLALAVVSFIGVAGELRERAQFIPFAYITATDLVLLALYFLPTLLSLLVPVAYMMGILLAFGRFAQQNEIIAMKAAGIPLKRVLAPVLMGGLLLSVGLFFIQDRAQPWALSRANRLLFEEMPLRATLDVLPAGVMHEFGDWRVYIGSKDPDTRTLKNIDILMKQDGQPMALSAESAQVVEDADGKKIVLTNGYMTQSTPEGDLILFSFPTNTLELPKIATLRAPGKLMLRNLKQLIANNNRLVAQPALSGSDKKELRETRLEIGKRFSFPLACLSVALVAACSAVRAPRGGRSYSFAVGFIIVLSFFVL